MLHLLLYIYITPFFLLSITQFHLCSIHSRFMHFISFVNSIHLFVNLPTLGTTSMVSPTTNEKKVSSNDYICNDIAFSILSKLPIKYVKCFSCASKTWSLLFQNPYFLNKFRTKRNKIVSKLVQEIRIFK
jgi:hypothetical protein